MSEFILEQELDDIPSYCSECGKVHGPEACQYEDEDAGWDEEAPLVSRRALPDEGRSRT